MKARLIVESKALFEGGWLQQMVVWQVSTPSPERPHGLKYRLFFGHLDGRCLVRYDNETGKGDHRHVLDKEYSYQFTTIEQLISDFLADVRRVKT